MDSEKKLYLEHLQKGLKEAMEAQEKQNPVTRIRCKLVSVEKKSNVHLYSLRIVTMSKRGKISRVLREEEKLFIETPDGPLKCTIVEVDRDVVRVAGYGKLKGSNFEAVLDPKYNSKTLLDSLGKFIESGKSFSDFIIKSWRANSGLEKNSLEFSKAPEAGKLSLYDTSLNESQKRAVETIGLNVPYKILGPPGTGKTRTVVEIISQLLTAKNRVLVCGPSNVSVDNIIERFLKSKYFLHNAPSFYRLGSSLKGLSHLNLDSLAKSHTKFMKEEKNDRNFYRDRKEKQKEFMKEKQTSSSVVFATLFSSLKERTRFDWVLIDEACQASEVESFLAVVKGKMFILIGDPMQLCPETSSLYETLALPVVLLNEQYRMPSGLMRFSNDMFYRGEIKSATREHKATFGESPILFVDTQYFELYESNDVSKSNVGEAMIVKSIVEILKGEEVGIIAPYTSQVLLLQEIVDVEVSTVDGFQGQERDYIILTLVRCNDREEFGFLDNEKRLNVALTRCKKGLVIVGDSRTFRRSDIFQKLFKFLKANSLCLDPETLKEFIRARQ
ncbi:putative DNA helicase [Encephalitozoon hellem ATCC 50504]|uniref:DNA/RNA helicase n=1 Tax=Encephalitozoon hellem TaxID=27973 RepID=A0A9Q9FBH8_ENCHE|nr:putative DNA helicase [Encephalitozoon hellem ATCC 50504]AFM98330.1 putative DNA helicase [Encephalitozoon hellem ATCC 50504]UTX43210.1 DNA/RNA helicase [Encephalitozoon hellem]|eukprot:XP_003887311.1 putative DNA helicase [Encephalitozoon hellem ATCC 50504]